MHVYIRWEFAIVNERLSMIIKVEKKINCVILQFAIAKYRTLHVSYCCTLLRIHHNYGL